LPKTVCFASFFHPEIVRGGEQEVAYELFNAAKRDPDVRPLLICSVPPGAAPGLERSGAFVTGFDHREDQFLFFPHEFDHFMQRITNPLAVRRFREFLIETKPDVVHFHHTLMFGADLLTVVKNTCPSTKLFFTFHEFVSICNASGQMVRTNQQGLCEFASPARCNQCFPHIPQDAFFFRRKWLLGHFDRVDGFIAPTEFVKQRLTEWGIDGAKIQVISNGQTNLAPEGYGGRTSIKEENKGRKSCFAFFGQLVDNKGLHVFLDAVDRLLNRGVGDFDIEIHGANLDFASPSYREEIDQRLRKLKEKGFQGARISGSYDHHRLPDLMSRADWVVVPSTWWEIFGLVVSEAWMFGLPVIASDIGGLRERITHGKDGLLFPAGDVGRLADIMEECLGNGELWHSLHKNCRPPLSADEAWKLHKELMLGDGEAKAS